MRLKKGRFRSLTCIAFICASIASFLALMRSRSSFISIFSFIASCGRKARRWKLLRILRVEPDTLYPRTHHQHNKHWDISSKGNMVSYFIEIAGGRSSRGVLRRSCALFIPDAPPQLPSTTESAFPFPRFLARSPGIFAPIP